jgi:hypothetical protein
MKESMPDTHGWVDRGPSKRPKPKPELVTVRGVKLKVSAVIRQGTENPRALTPDEQERSFTNQVAADADLAAWEKWYADGCCVPEADR